MFQYFHILFFDLSTSSYTDKVLLLDWNILVWFPRLIWTRYLAKIEIGDVFFSFLLFIIIHKPLHASGHTYTKIHDPNLSLHIHMLLRVNVYAHTLPCACIHLLMQIHTYIYIHIYIHMHISKNVSHDYRFIDIDACICTCTLYMHTPSYEYAYSSTLVDVGLG